MVYEYIYLSCELRRMRAIDVRIHQPKNKLPILIVEGRVWLLRREAEIIVGIKIIFIYE